MIASFPSLLSSTVMSKAVSYCVDEGCLEISGSTTCKPNFTDVTFSYAFQLRLASCIWSLCGDFYEGSSIIDFTKSISPRLLLATPYIRNSYA